jgi:hypothetical protein
MGYPPPDAIHLSVEPGVLCGWISGGEGQPQRRHIALSLLDLRLVSHDEARAIIAHEIAHLGFEHALRDHENNKTAVLMEAMVEKLPLPFNWVVRFPQLLFHIGLRIGAHDHEREADLKAAQVVGGNHVAAALKRTYLQSPVLERVFHLVLDRALTGPRAPLRLAEAAATVFASHDFTQLREDARESAERPGARHPSLHERVAQAQREQSRAGISGKTAFIDAYPELLAVEELLTKSYFPDTPTYARSDASQLRRRALAARLRR